MSAGSRARTLTATLARAGAQVARAGLVVGSGGNLSARPIGADECLVTASGAWLDRLGARSFSTVEIGSGRPVDATGSPSSEVALHLAVYRARADVAAVIHLHPQTTILLDLLDESIRLVTTDHAYYVRRVTVAPFHPPGSQELADAVAVAVADGTNCVILPHHGCAVVAPTVDLALRRALNLEEASRLTYRALLLTGGVHHRPLPECPIQFADEATV